MKILVIQMARFGDLIQSVLLLDRLRAAYPGAEISILVDKPLLGLVETLSLADVVFCLDIRALAGDRSGIIGSYSLLRSALFALEGKKFDLVVNLNFSTIAIAVLRLLNPAGVRGFFCGDGPLSIKAEGEFMALVESVRAERKKRATNLADIFKSAAGTASCDLLSNKPGYSKDYRAGRPEADGKKPVVVLQTGAGSSMREWPKEYYAELIDRLYGLFNATVIMVGSGSESERGEQIISISGQRPENMIGKTSFKQLAELIKGADLLITPDTGTMHLAALLGVNIIAMFWGSASCHETGPYTENAYILQAEPDCFPCRESKNSLCYDCRLMITPLMFSALIEGIQGLGKPFGKQKPVVDRLKQHMDKVPVHLYSGRFVNDSITFVKIT